MATTKKQNWLQEASLRLSQSTPWFFKILIRIGLVSTAIGTGLLLLTAMPGIVLNEWIPKIASHMLVVGVVIAGISKMTTTTPQDLPNNQPNPVPKDVSIDDVQHTEQAH